MRCSSSEYRASLSSPGRYPVRANVSYAHYAMDYTAALIDFGVYLDELSASASWIPSRGWTVGGAAGTTLFTSRETGEENRRVNGNLAVARRISRPITLGVAGRFFGFDRDLNEGYFDPDFYGLAEVTARLLRESRHWSLEAELAPGVQRRSSETLAGHQRLELVRGVVGAALFRRDEADHRRGPVSLGRSRELRGCIRERLHADLAVLLRQPVPLPLAARRWHHVRARALVAEVVLGGDVVLEVGKAGVVEAAGRRRGTTAPGVARRAAGVDHVGRDPVVVRLLPAEQHAVGIVRVAARDERVGQVGGGAEIIVGKRLGGAMKDVLAAAKSGASKAANDDDSDDEQEHQAKKAEQRRLRATAPPAASRKGLAAPPRPTRA